MSCLVHLCPLLAAASFISFSTGQAHAAKLVHRDETVIEGEIVSENVYEIRVKSRYGTFTYDKADLVRIVRDEQTSAVRTTTIGEDLSKLLPPGPIDPMAPPKPRPLVRYHKQLRPAPVQTTSATLQTTATQ